MVCKNCGSPLRTDYSFCPNCGAKVIRNRITVKNLWYDVIERYFNLDNSFLRTLKDLVLKPELVCHGYISGIRKRYLDPISLLAISLTLSGVILFIMKNISWETIDFSTMPFSNGESSEKIMSITMEYSSILFLFYIPLFAICGFLLLNKKMYNLPEHMIIAMYALAAFSVITFPYSLITLLFTPQLYLEVSLYYSVVMIIYCLYVAYRNSPGDLVQLLWKVPVYVLLFLMGFFGVSIVFNIVLLITGAISIEDMVPKN
ncbi:DUF3667 domain-containing protein [Flagellimonas sp.]|uniref:DUF3667 domain-containing protein n=1 Tax=Flagellimonas sp. TaxID=2058762 RepID=UPI003F4A5449